MVDIYGATEIPLIRSQNGEDKFIDYTLQYLQAVCNAHASVEWQHLWPNFPSAGPVRTLYQHDPTAYYMRAPDLPVLIMRRTEQKTRVQLAEDIRVERGMVGIIWVPPIVKDQPTQVARNSFADKLFKLMDMYIEIGRDPSWYVPGDTQGGSVMPGGTTADLAANVKRRGSVLANWAGFRRLWLESSTPAPIVIKMAGQGPSNGPIEFPAFQCLALYEETLKIDAAAHYVPFGGIDVTIETDPHDPQGPLVTEHFLLT